MTSDYIDIDGKRIGRGHKPYIVAEISANHNGDINKALQTIEVAAACGADAVKIQTYTADTMTIDSDKPDFRIDEGLWAGTTLYDLYRTAETPYEWHQALFDKAREVGITLFSTPFDETAIELLESLNAPAYKIASFELTDLPLVAAVAQTGKPMIMSTGMASLEEIEDAVTCARDNGCKELVLLHCISGYPTPIEQANPATISDLQQRFDCPIGLSDHTLGTTASVCAAALGACFIEKHFIIDRNDGGPDSSFSLEPDDLRKLVTDTADAFSALGVVGYERRAAEQQNARFRRSIYFVKDMKAGDTIGREHIRRIRPGFGLAPRHYNELLGKRVTRDISRGTAAAWELVE